MTTQAKLPVVNLEPLITPDYKSSIEYKELIQSIIDSVSSNGAFFVTGHGISNDLIKKILKETRYFFNQRNNKKALFRGYTNNLSAGGYAVRAETSYILPTTEKNIQYYKEVLSVGPSSHSFSYKNLTNSHREFSKQISKYYQQSEKLMYIIYNLLSDAIGMLSGISLSKNFIRKELGDHNALLRFNFHK